MFENNSTGFPGESPVPASAETPSQPGPDTGSSAGPSGAAFEEKKEKKKPGFKTGLLAGIVITLCIVLVITLAGGYALTGGVLTPAAAAKLGVLDKVIESSYYKDVKKSDLQNGLYKGIVSGLNDPYSEYYTPKEAKELTESLTGNYAGIGAGLSQDKKTMVVTVSFVYDGSPAREAGLQKGDIIESVDGIESTSMELSDLVQKIRGMEGTEVSLVVVRDGIEKTYDIERKEIQIPSVSSAMLKDGVGYIRITEFSSGTAEEFDKAVDDLTSRGMKSVIFDLRDNPGGLVDAVTKVLDRILPKGTVVYTVDNEGKREDYTSDEDTKLSIPMAVLINGNSASAAEIFAGAVRDFKAGTLIGTKSYGKGVVQSTIPLADGSMVKLTTMEYFTPSGENIQGKGITPDVTEEYEFLGSDDEYDAISKKSSEELTADDYLLDGQVKTAFDKLTGK